MLPDDEVVLEGEPLAVDSEEPGPQRIVACREHPVLDAEHGSDPVGDRRERCPSFECRRASHTGGQVAVAQTGGKGVDIWDLDSKKMIRSFPFLRQRYSTGTASRTIYELHGTRTLPLLLASY